MTAAEQHAKTSYAEGLAVGVETYADRAEQREEIRETIAVEERHQRDPEVEAVRVDAELRFQELRAARAVLLPDADDPEILSELTAIESQMRSAQQAIASNNA
jgi:hypothetical protein